MLESDDLSTYFWDSDSDAKNSDLDSNPEDSDSDLAHNRPVMLSHYYLCIETVCVLVFSQLLTYLVSLQ